MRNIVLGFRRAILNSPSEIALAVKMSEEDQELDEDLDEDADDDGWEEDSDDDGF